MEINKLSILSEIKGFLDGYNNDLKYLVNVETDNDSNIGYCVIHEPNKEKEIKKIYYEPFMYMKDLEKLGYQLYYGHSNALIESKRKKYGITITKLKTGNQKRLVDGYCYKITSSKSYNSIVNYFKDGGIDPFEKQYDEHSKPLRDIRGNIIYKNRELFHSVRTNEQFFISTKSRLYKGLEEYKDVHKLTFDIETTGLRYQISRMFAIGVRDNRGFEMILVVDKLDDDESEIRLIQDFFSLINILKPAVISGYNSEMFDFEYILGRVKLLKMSLDEIPTSLNIEKPLKRKPNTSVKIGNSPQKYTATEMWGYSVIDILHAAKKTAALNSDLQRTGLKYIAKYEKIAKPNRTYIKGEDNSIGKFYAENKVFLIDKYNNYIQVPDEYQETARKLYVLQMDKNLINIDAYTLLKNKYLSENKNFVDWFRTEALPKELITFIGGENLVKQYLLDDLWETEHVDELYNQSSFMIAKILPTSYQRICTMGTAGIWNLLLTTWSYENDLAIPIPDKPMPYSGGLARTYKIGFESRIRKIDYASLYPMNQLDNDIFPMFDITGVIKKILLYLTTARNIYKKLAKGTKLNNDEITLLKEIDHEVHLRYIANELTATDKAMFNVKQLPIKILNNSLYGALGSAVSFNWSDNNCASRITCVGRLHLRHAIHWFTQYGCVPLLAVTDGVNFNYPIKTNIKVTDEGVSEGVSEGVIEGVIEEMWQYNGKVGIQALIEKYNKELQTNSLKTRNRSSYISVDDDGEYISCLNLARINYATLLMTKDKKTGELYEKVKFTGNTIKSKAMPEYIEDFIDKGLTMILHGHGKEFVEYYYDYCDNIRYMRIPLKKIANKSRYKTTLTAYKKRGVNKNGKEKSVQAHMELLIEQREKIARELFSKHINEFIEDCENKTSNDFPIDKIFKLVANYMPPEPELDSVIYYYNSGYKKSHGDSRKIVDKDTGIERYCSAIINNEDLIENPNMLGKYNYEKYLAAFNLRVKTLLIGFDPEIRKKILTSITKEGDLKKEMFTNEQLQLKTFDFDDFDESMHLEEVEVDFWNKTGYDPRLIWNGFKEKSDNRVYYEIYDNALNFLNKKMIENNNPLIKSINDNYGNGDLVLIKDGCNYSVGSFNGVYMQIVRENIQIPKTEIELELDKKREELERKIEELRTIEIENNANKEAYLNSQEGKREKYFPLFKKKFKQPKNFTIDNLLVVEGGIEMLDEFILIIENGENDDMDNEDFDEGDY